jgi:hypothetical protein
MALGDVDGALRLGVAGVEKLLRLESRRACDLDLAVEMCAVRCWSAWNAPIGWPNRLRVFR